MVGCTILATLLSLAPAGTRDRTADIQAAVDAVRLAGGGRIVFSPGEYRLVTPVQARWWVSNHHDPMPRNVFLPVTNVADVVLESTDARFICDGEGIALALVDTTNVTVRGLSFDYARPYFSEWRLKDGRLVGDRAEFPWKVEDGKLLTSGRGWTSPQRLAEFFDGTTRTFLGAQWWSGAPDEKFAYPDGSVVVTRGGFRPNPTVFLYRAVNTTFADCGVYSSAGIGLMAQRSDTVSVHGWRTRNGRYFTSLQADATHFSNCRGAVTVTDSVFEGMVDDAINVHSTCLEIVEIPARNRLVCRYRHPASVGFEVFLPGERLRLIRSRTLEPDAEVIVRAAEMKGAEFVHLTLDRPVPDAYGVGDAVENADWQPSVVFRGNVVRNSKPRATLFTTPGRVVCESNLFDHVAGHPVELAGDALDWYESGACRDVTIRGNVFRSCGKVGGKAMVLIDPQVRDPAHQRARYHRNIRIEGNRFEDFEVPLVAGHSVSNLVLRDNVVVDGPSTVELRHSESVVVGRAAGAKGPEAWLAFMGGNVSKEGLQKDLEEIRKAGLSGVHFFHINRGGAWPGCPEQIRCMDAKWDDVVSFLGDTCRRLGLKLTIQNCPGWSQSGGPWIAVTNAMREVACAHTVVRAGQAAMRPCVPAAHRDADSDWRDIAVLAFPTPLDDAADELKPVQIVTNGFDRTYVFDRPVTIRTAVWKGGLDGFNPRYSYHAPWMHVKLEAVAEDGTAATALDSDLPVSDWRDYVHSLSLACHERTARTWRYSFSHLHPVEAYTEPVFLSAARQTDWEGKSSRVLRSRLFETPPRQDARCWVRPEDVVDLTGRVRSDGTLDWSVPPGEWTLLRVGHVNAKRVNAPAPPEATGWECDKLAPEGIEASFAGYVERLAAGALAGKLDGVLVDSWECFGQTWTPCMERYFREANGYEVRRNLPALFGWVIGDPAETDRFLTDWRRTIGDLIARNYYGRLADLAHARGLSVAFETAFGDIVAGDLLEYWKHADEPMCEFWLPHASKTEGFVGSYAFKPIRPCASAAHVYGKRRVTAEAFTGWGISWKEDLRELRDVANRHFARGVTHLALQSYTHTPNVNALPPGACMGGFNGTPFTWQQTWWRHMPVFTGWLARCEERLEEGVCVQDVLWYLGDAVDHKPDEDFAFPEGFRADYLNHDVLTNRLSVANGRFVIPEGASWRVLWVPERRFLRPATERRLVELASAGGRIVYGGKERLAQALADLRKDVATEPALGDEPSEDFMWLHRRIGPLDRYFVAAGTNGYRGKVTFRADGPVSLYDPVTETRRGWRNGAELVLAPSQSLFVEFGIAADEPSAGMTRVRTLEASWWIAFEPGWGAPASLPLERPVSWTEIPGLSEEARAYSGTAVYGTEFECEAEEAVACVRLDLGRVESVAKVLVNGRPVRTLWCEPYTCELTGMLKPGRNTLRVEVTNVWRNRVLYDLNRPKAERKTWTIHRPGLGPDLSAPLLPAGLLGPVRLIMGERNGGTADQGRIPPALGR